MTENKTPKQPLLFRLIRGSVKMFTPRYQVEERTDIDPKGSIFVANHAKTNGPIGLQLYFPYPKKLWVIGSMCNIKEVPSYVMDDFWRFKPWYIKWAFRLFSYMIAPLSVYIMKHAGTIPVYKDLRIKITLSQTVKALSESENVIIFPEYRKPDNRYLNQFQLNFVDCAKVFYQHTHRCVNFYPVYVCRSLRKIVIGAPIAYNPQLPMPEERVRIAQYLSQAIVGLAESLPEHKIVPYDIARRKHSQ